MASISGTQRNLHGSWMENNINQHALVLSIQFLTLLWLEVLNTIWQIYKHSEWAGFSEKLYEITTYPRLREIKKDMHFLDVWFLLVIFWKLCQELFKSFQVGGWQTRSIIEYRQYLFPKEVIHNYRDRF